MMTMRDQGRRSAVDFPGRTRRRRAGLVVAAAALSAALGAPIGAIAQSKPPIPKSNLVLVVSVINTTNPYI